MGFELEDNHSRRGIMTILNTVFVNSAQTRLREACHWVSNFVNKDQKYSWVINKYNFSHVKCLPDKPRFGIRACMYVRVYQSL